MQFILGNVFNVIITLKGGNASNAYRKWFRALKSLPYERNVWEFSSSITQEAKKKYYKSRFLILTRPKLEFTDMFYEIMRKKNS